MNKFLHISVFAPLILGCFSAHSQQIGDTVVVPTINFGSQSRDTTIDFSTLPSVSFEKVLMQYTMRCKDAVVNNTGGNNIGCGEFALNVNTFLHDGSKVDSARATAPSHTIAGFTGSVFNYTSNPTHNIFQTLQQSTTVTNVISETLTNVGNGNTSISTTIPTAQRNAKSQYLFTATELTQAGFSAGEIDAVEFNVLSGTASAQNFRCKIKSTTKTSMVEADPDLSGWSTVYYQNTTFQPGINRLQFAQPFNWNGTSNVIVEFSYSNLSNGTTLQIQGSSLLNSVELAVQRDFYHFFDGTNYVEADAYKGISGANPRTIEAWINTTVPNKEIVSWGQDVPGEKWVFRINETGELRVEIASGNIWGTTILTDGLWHHVACVFNGANVSDVQLYVDGQLETISPGGLDLAVNTNTESGLRVRISRGVNDRYFVGAIDEVRIWDTALSATTLGDWRYRKLSGSHPNAANLALHYTMSEGTGTVVNDASGNNRHAHSVDGGLWNEVRGENLFKGFTASVRRPNFSLVRGDYNQTTTNVVTNDTIFNLPNPVTTYVIIANPGTLNDDIVSVADYQLLWNASENVTFDPNGNIIATVDVLPEGTINVGTLNYIVRRAMRYELSSLVSPFGVGLDLGVAGETFTFDLTDFAPIFTGSKRITVERGGQFQEDLDINFIFIVGTPPRDVLDVRQVWRAENLPFQSIVNNSFFEPRQVPTLATAESFKLRSAITGLGAQGQFTPFTHSLIVGTAPAIEWEVWKECSANPMYPQANTWIYDRAGWCPGMPTDLEENDITAQVTPGQPVTIDYEILNATGTANYLVSHQMVSYGAPNHSLDAAILEVRRPSSRIEFRRVGNLCENAQIVIQNRGSETLTSLTLTYWINTTEAVSSFQWTGNLGFMETEVVEVPMSLDLLYESTLTNNKFFVELTNVNGAGDDNYAPNNRYESKFTLPGVVPEGMIVRFQTNDNADENRYEIIDLAGNVIFERDNLEANTLYEDNLTLAEGCYTFKVYDTDGDGLSFPPATEGIGSVSFLEENGTTFLTFPANFGSGLNYSFSVNEVLSDEIRESLTGLKLYPNPAADMLSIDASGFDGALEMSIFDITGRLVKMERFPANSSKFQTQVNVSELSKGVYLVKLSSGKVSHTERLVKQ